MKNSVLNRSLLGIIASLAVLQLSAHTLGHGTVTGSLRDGDTKEPIPFTSIVVLRAADHRLAAVGTTDAEGNFKLKFLPLGDYVIQSTALGYQLQQPTVTFRPLSNRQKLGTLTLQSLSSQPRVQAPRQTVAQRANCAPAPKLAVRS